MRIRKCFSAMTVAALLCAFMLGAGSAQASTITYVVSGTFDGGILTSVSTGSGGNTATITYAGQTNTYVFNGSTNIALGDFFSSALGLGATFGPHTFNLVLNQTAPVPTGGNPQNFGASFSGTITPTSNGVVVLFSNTTADITTAGENFHYVLSNPVLLVPPNSSTVPPGDTTLQGFVTATSAVPEPASMGLFGGGLVGLAFLARRRRVS